MCITKESERLIERMTERKQQVQKETDPEDAVDQQHFLKDTINKHL